MPSNDPLKILFLSADAVRFARTGGRAAVDGPVRKAIQEGTASLYTIHTLAYHGIFGYRMLEIAGIDEYGFIVHPEMHDLNDVVDFMARGILFSDVITTVSPRYAEEILTPEFGERHDPILR